MPKLPRFFKPAARYPADPRAIFILALSVFSGLGALALDATPATLEAVLPRWGVLAWGVFLVLGSAITLTGMAFQSLNGIITEQIGSVIVGATTVFYSALAFWVVGDAAYQPVGIILAWGLSCFIRWGQLQALINRAYKQKIHTEAVQAAVEVIEARQGPRGDRGYRGFRGSDGDQGEQGPKGDPA